MLRAVDFTVLSPSTALAVQLSLADTDTVRRLYRPARLSYSFTSAPKQTS